MTSEIFPITRSIDDHIDQIEDLGFLNHIKLEVLAKISN